MKPITVDNPDGRTLLALRAGPMTSGELSARVGYSPSSWLINAGYIAQDDSFYRLTEAGRTACPYRNPLAAPGVVSPATFQPEETMSIVTRQQVLAAIVAAGQAGTSPKNLIADFSCSDSVIYNHINLLGKQQPPVIFKPKNGLVCAIQFQQVGTATPAPKKLQHATREGVMACLEKQPQSRSNHPDTISCLIGCDVDSTRAVLAGLYADMKIERQKVGDTWCYFMAAETQYEAPAITPSPETPAKIALKSPLTVELPPVTERPATLDPALADLLIEAGQQQPIEINAVPDRRSPTKIDVDADDLEIGIFSDGSMDLLVDDGLVDAQLKFTDAAVTKIRRFLGLFQEAA